MFILQNPADKQTQQTLAFNIFDQRLFAVFEIFNDGLMVKFQSDLSYFKRSDDERRNYS